jgi:hypothetical protein
MIMTAEQFTKATGAEPINDDLDRCNCDKAGEIGHWYCGWDAEANLPIFMYDGRRIEDVNTVEISHGR